MEKIENVWEFVEKYYPNYYSSDEIAENDDLHKIAEGELNGYAEIWYNEAIEEKNIFFGGTLDEVQIAEEVSKDFYNLLQESNAYIFEKAIEGYLETFKN
jgi:hypothetical protein